MALFFGANCDLGAQLAERLSTQAPEDEDLNEVVADTFGTKSTSTLKNRASSMLQFVRWMRTRGPDRGIDEAVVYEYVASLRAERPRTRT